jgi:hypothetical protein
VPPWQAFVALGMVATSSEEEPDTKVIRCVPLSWCKPVEQDPVKVWDSTGAGGRVVSLWRVGKLGVSGRIHQEPQYGAPTVHY